MTWWMIVLFLVSVGVSIYAAVRTVRLVDTAEDLIGQVQASSVFKLLGGDA